MKSRIALSAALLVLPATGRAEVHAWTVCMPGMFRTCHSVAISTTGSFSGGVRTGTQVTIAMTNLQGSGFPADNSSEMGLSSVRFFGRRASPMPATEHFNLQHVASGGAIDGSPVQVYTGDSTAAGLRYAHVSVFNVGEPIGGCDTRLPFQWGGSITCGVHQVITVTFDIASIFEASDFEAVQISVFAIGRNASGGPGQCYSGPEAFGAVTGSQACDLQSESLNGIVTPEPLTITLLGTGLFGVGAARWRRRRPVPGDPA